METISSICTLDDLVVRIQERIQKAFPDLQMIWDASLLRLANYCAQQGSQRKYIQKNAIVELYPYAKDVIQKIATVRPTSRKKTPTLFLEKLTESKLINDALAEKKINSVGIAAVKNPNGTFTCAFVGYNFNIPEDIYTAISEEPHDFSAQSLFDAFNKLHSFVIHSDLKQSEELAGIINKYKPILQEDPEKIKNVQKELNEACKDKGTFVVLSPPQIDSLPEFLKLCVQNCDFQNVIFTNTTELASDLVVDKNGKNYVFVLANYAPLPLPPEESKIYKRPGANKDLKKISIEEYLELLKACIVEQREKAGAPKVELGEQNIIEQVQKIVSFACTNKTPALPKRIKEDLSKAVGEDYFLSTSFSTSGLTEEGAREYIESVFQSSPSALDAKYNHFAIAIAKDQYAIHEVYIAIVLYQ